MLYITSIQLSSPRNLADCAATGDTVPVESVRSFFHKQINRVALIAGLLLFSIGTILPAVAQDVTQTDCATSQKSLNNSAGPDTGAIISSSTPPLNGSADTKEQAALSKTVDTLLNSSLNKSAAFSESDKAVNRYRTGRHKAWSKMKDASNFIVPWHGFGPSSEAGDVILNEKLKLKSLDAAEYSRQTQIDSTHVEVLGQMLQLAKCLGSNDSTEAATVRCELEKLTSPDETKTLEAFIRELEQIDIAEAIQNFRTPMSAWEKRKRKIQLADSFIKNDPVIDEITKRIHQYNKRTGVARISGHVVETTLGLANWIPNVLAPLSQGTLMSFEMANGGSEENKLIKELYLERRLQTRRESLTDMAQLLFDSYQDALSQGNCQLAALAKIMMTEYGDAKTTELVVDAHTVKFNLVEENVNAPQMQATAP